MIAINTIKPVLLVEDDYVDIMTVQRSFRDLNVLNPLVVKHNGEDAIQYLSTAGNELPCVILLDINMPKMNGLEFLQTINRRYFLSHIPVVMLTSSKEQQDVDRCFVQGVAGYILKPVDYRQFLLSIQVLNPYWTIKETE
jgi:CheY-like chemotaxis protein